jgi:hypothetical protein
VKGGVKAYEIKVKCYGEHVGEHIGNQRKMKKNPFLPPPEKNLKEEKQGSLSAWDFPLAA